MKKKFGFRLLLIGSIILQSNFCKKDLQAVVLAAGKSTRFKSITPKIIYPFSGKPMILHILGELDSLNIPITLVVGHKKEMVIKAVLGNHLQQLNFIIQNEQRGTGHALSISSPRWHADSILLLCGDMPLIPAWVIQKLKKEHLRSKAAITFVAAHNVDPKNSFGRIVVKNGKTEIIEKKHFTNDINEYPLVNAGIYIFKREFLEKYLGQLQINPVSNEIYVTDLVGIASDNNEPISMIEIPFEYVHGINTLEELAAAEKLKIKRYCGTNGIYKN